jgi:6-pyruvoyltetrahydropterin/6-carboxytetrahydropterin synthase
MIYLTRRETFSSSHRLYNPEFSSEVNNAIYGKCNNEHGHGHNFVLEVVVKGEINPRTGYVIDLKELKDIIHEYIIEKVDHRHLNYDVDFMKGIIPTTENFAVAIWNQLKDNIKSGKLCSVKLYETENNYVEYKGE